MRQGYTRSVVTDKWGMEFGGGVYETGYTRSVVTDKWGMVFGGGGYETGLHKKCSY